MGGSKGTTGSATLDSSGIAVTDRWGWGLGPRREALLYSFKQAKVGLSRLCSKGPEARGLGLYTRSRMVRHLPDSGCFVRKL